jgi:hypothetical protein
MDSGKQPASPAMVAVASIPLGSGLIVAAIVGDAMWFWIGLGIVILMVPIINAWEKRNNG